MAKPKCPTCGLPLGPKYSTMWDSEKKRVVKVHDNRQCEKPYVNLNETR